MRVLRPVVGQRVDVAVVGLLELAGELGELVLFDVDAHQPLGAGDFREFKDVVHARQDALADGRIDPSLPFIKQQALAALTAAYTDTEQAKGGIDGTLRNYYQKTYPQVYASKQPAIHAAIAYLQRTYSQYFYPAMKVRWDTYYVNEGHFQFPGCFRCHDGQHRSLDGKVISADCGECHRILQQGKAGSLQFAKGPEGLTFEHPIDIGGAWAEQPCNSCHTGGPQ
jgi:hypothetical protein